MPLNSDLSTKNFKKILFFSLFSIFYTTSYAQSLIKVVENPEATFYVRTDNLRKSGNSVDFWQVTDFKQPKLNKKGESYLSMEQHLIIDCAASTQNLVFVKVFSSNMLSGKMIASGAAEIKRALR